MTTPDTRATDRTITHWHCERCNRRGQVEHDAHAGVWEVFQQICTAHHRAGWCIEADRIRVWQDTAAARKDT